MSIEKVGLIYDERRAQTKPWKVRWFGEFDPTTGKQRRYCRSFGRKREAENFQAELTADLNGGTKRDKPPSITLKAFCEAWLQMKKPSIRDGTLTRYREVIQRLYRHFGTDEPLEKITLHAAELFMAQQKRMKAHVRDKPLSRWTRARILRSCRTIFKTAVKWKHIKENPFADIQPIQGEHHPWHQITPEEFRRLMEKTRTLRLRCFYAVMYGAGLRVGEALNLTWSSQDIDFVNGRINVRNRLPSADLPGFSIKDHQGRSVPMPSWLTEMLKELKAQKSMKGSPFPFLTPQRWGRVKAMWDQFCQQDIRDQWHSRFMLWNTLRDFKVHCRWAGIHTNEKLTLHCLRKSYAQNLADAGTPQITLRRLMGHSSIRVTEQYYLKITDANEQQAKEVLERIMT